jgi:alpha-L-fucosidase
MCVCGERARIGTLVNDRIGVPGDYVTPEQSIKQAHFSVVDQSVNQELKPGVPRPEDFQLWETCMTINNNTWAYNKNDHEYKSAQYLIRALVEVASRGGNFLLNVGPQPTGSFNRSSRSGCERSEIGWPSTGSRSMGQAMVPSRA